MLIVNELSYIHPDRVSLFEHINLSVNNGEKMAVVGNNGAGKSTFLRILAGGLPPTSGQIMAQARPYLVPQIFGQYNHLTIAQALGIDKKLTALQHILKGDGTDEWYHALADDWTVQDRCLDALKWWQLDKLDLNQRLETLSGGQKTKVFLAGISVHQAQLVLLDEPSNHLDAAGRDLLYSFLYHTKCTLIVVSHDRRLLNLLHRMCELEAHGIREYGGNYDFYTHQKHAEQEALNQSIHHKEKSLRKAKEKQRESLERQQKLDSRGKGKQAKAGVARIMMNTLRNSAENSTAKMKSAHGEKMEGIAQELQALRSTLPDIDKMKFGFDYAALHRGKMLFDAAGINLDYGGGNIWPENLTVQIRSGDRISLTGRNGSGKTSLLHIILGRLQPSTGQVHKIPGRPIYVDQEYSLISHALKVYEQAQRYNVAALEEHEVKIRLTRFLFSKESWDKPCSALSGGERLRLTLCCLTLDDQMPDLLILDEPTNNLDRQNVDLLTAVIAGYKGTLIVVSHDEQFLKEVGISTVLKV